MHDKEETDAQKIKRLEQELNEAASIILDLTATRGNKVYRRARAFTQRRKNTQPRSQP